MSSRQHERRIRELKKKLDGHHKKQADEAAKVSKAEREINKLRGKAQKTRSESLRRSYQGQIEREQRKAEKARTAASKTSADVSSTQKKIHEEEDKLHAARATERRQEERREERHRREAERKRNQAEKARASEEARRDQEIESLSERTTDLESKLLAASRREAPPEITVLFLAASPEDEDTLRLDQETREIQKRVRSSEHRESINFEWKLARQLPDLLQDLNETRPHIVHFSGHGDQAELVFEDADGNARPLSNELLAQLLASSSDRIRLTVFNSCQSTSQAELACEHIDMAIGMSSTIEDEAAKTFAGQFYNSLGFGKSVAEAFDQACLQITLVHGEGHEIPELFSAHEVDSATVVLVNPPGATDSN